MTNSEKRDYLDLFCDERKLCQFCPFEKMPRLNCCKFKSKEIPRKAINRYYKIAKDFRKQQLKSRYGTEGGD